MKADPCGSPSRSGEEVMTKKWDFDPFEGYKGNLT